MSYPFHTDPPSVADAGDEYSIQTRLRARCKIVAPGIKLVAIPNAAKRSYGTAMRNKAEGMSAGFPDLEALWDGGHAYLEMKQRTGSLEPAQVDWLNWLHRNGHRCGMFRSVDTAMAFLRDCGAPVLERAA